jgi:class 3 adenylate cyclase/pimeloyl-ACP methyl ester carboxylesterase
MSGDFPEVRYADADGVSIAYCVRGNGPIDLVRVPGPYTGILASTVDPVLGSHYEHLAGFARLVLLDRRGLGMSDPLVAGGAPPIEQQVHDILAVMNAVGSRQAALYGGADGGPVALLFAAMHPGRVSAVVLNSTWARWDRAPDYPVGVDPAFREQQGLLMRSRWGDLGNPWGIEAIAPSRLDDPSFRQVLARVQQVSASRAAVSAAFLNAENDVRAALPLVQAPTLVLCGADSVDVGGLQLLGQSQFLVDHIPNARLALFPGADMYFGVHTPEMGALIEEFLTGTRPVPVSDRVLATVLFTDIVASTERLAELGDQEWRAHLDDHDAMVRTQLERFRGREINTAGDGFFATFDGPARAVRCAQAIADGARPLGIDVRAGVHVGECEVRGDDLAGIAVHIGARVCALAQPGEVLATTTVRDLVAGSGIEFADRGCHTLKGVPGKWTILAAEV